MSTPKEGKSSFTKPLGVWNREHRSNKPIECYIYRSQVDKGDPERNGKNYVEWLPTPYFSFMFMKMTYTLQIFANVETLKVQFAIFRAKSTKMNIKLDDFTLIYNFFWCFFTWFFLFLAIFDHSNLISSSLSPRQEKERKWVGRKWKISFLRLIFQIVLQILKKTLSKLPVLYI